MALGPQEAAARTAPASWTGQLVPLLGASKPRAARPAGSQQGRPEAHRNQVSSFLAPCESRGHVLASPVTSTPEGSNPQGRRRKGFLVPRDWPGRVLPSPTAPALGGTCKLHLALGFRASGAMTEREAEKGKGAREEGMETSGGNDLQMHSSRGSSVSGLREPGAPRQSGGGHARGRNPGAEPWPRLQGSSEPGPLRRGALGLPL